MFLRVVKGNFIQFSAENLYSTEIRGLSNGDDQKWRLEFCWVFKWVWYCIGKVGPPQNISKKSESPLKVYVYTPEWTSFMNDPLNEFYMNRKWNIPFIDEKFSFLNPWPFSWKFIMMKIFPYFLFTFTMFLIRWTDNMNSLWPFSLISPEMLLSLRYRFTPLNHLLSSASTQLNVYTCPYIQTWAIEIKLFETEWTKKC